MEKTVSEISAHAKIRGFTEEREGGQVFYEAALMVDGHARDVLIDARGEVVEVEEQVALRALPASVQAAIRAKAGASSIVSVESIAKGGRIVAYEAHLRSKGKNTEVQVGPNGETLDHEE